jgi:Flp pilus assembly protein TadG
MKILHPLTVQTKHSGHKSERGQSLVELAISLIILLFLLAGVIDLGRAFFAFMAMRDAAQEGASYGAMFPQVSDTDNSLNTAKIIERTRSASSSPLDMNSGNINVTITVVGGQACAGNGMRVAVDYPNFPMIMPLFSVFMGRDTIPIHAMVTDEIVRPRCP